MVSRREQLIHYEHVEFKDELDLAYKMNEFLNDSNSVINIVADDDTIRYLSTLLMSDFDFNPIYIQMDSINGLYCLRIYNNNDLEIFKFSDMKQLHDYVTFVHKTDIIDKNFEFNIDMVLFTYHDEDLDFVHGDVSELD